MKNFQNIKLILRTLAILFLLLYFNLSFSEYLLNTGETVTVVAGNAFGNFPDGGNIIVPEDCDFRINSFNEYTPSVPTNLTGAGPIIEKIVFGQVPTFSYSEFICAPAPITQEQFDNFATLDMSTGLIDEKLGGLVFRVNLHDHLEFLREYIVVTRPRPGEPGMDYILWDPYICGWRQYFAAPPISHEEIVEALLIDLLNIGGDVVEFVLDFTVVGGAAVGVFYVLNEGNAVPLILSLIPGDQIVSTTYRAVRKLKFVFTVDKGTVKAGQSLDFGVVHGLFKNLGHSDDVADNLVAQIAGDIHANPDLAYLFKENPETIKAWEFAINCPQGVRSNTNVLSGIFTALQRGIKNVDDVLANANVPYITKSTVEHILRGTNGGGIHHISALQANTGLKLYE